MTDLSGFQDFIRERKRTQAQQAILPVLKPDPESAGKAIELAPKVNQPVALVREQKDLFEKQVEDRRKLKVVDENEGFREFIRANPLNAEVAGNADEFEKLGLWEKLSKAPVLGFEAGAAQRQRGRAAITGMLGLDNTAELAAARSRAEKAEKAAEPLGGFWWFAGAMGSMVGNLAGDLPEGVAAGGAIAGAGAATGAGVPVGGAIATGVALAGAVTAVGSVWDDLNQAEDRLRKETGHAAPIPLTHKLAAAGTVGVVTALADKLTFGAVGNAAKPIVREMTEEALKRSLTDRVVNGYTTQRVLRPITEAAVAGAALEGMTSAITEISKDLAQAGTDPAYPTFLNNPERREQIVQSINEGLIAGGALGGGLSAPAVGLNAAFDRQRGRLSKEALKEHSKLIAERETSETYGRSKEAFEAFATQVHKDRTIEIDARHVVESGAMEELISMVPKLDAMLASAVERGGTVTVPYAKYLAKITPEADKALQPGIRFDPEGVTEREAEQLDLFHKPAEGESLPTQILPGNTSAQNDGQFNQLRNNLADAISVRDFTEAARIEKEINALAGREAEAAATSVEAAAETVNDLWLHPLFTSPAAVGMDAPRFNRYSRLLEEQVTAANTKALAAATREARRRQTVEWKGELDTAREEASSALNARPEVQALALFARGEWLGGATPLPEGVSFKLDKRGVGDAQLPKGVVGRKNALMPDDAAELFGYRSGKELVEALSRVGDEMSGRSYSQWRKESIEAGALARVEEKLGKLDENIEREARELALQRTQHDILNEELAALGEEVGAPPFREGDIRSRVREEFSQTPITLASNYKKFARETGNNGRGAEMALLKGSRDVVKAFDYKQQQVKSHAWAMEAQAFKRELERFEKRTKRLSKASRPSISQPFMDQIHSLLVRHDFPVRRDLDELSTALEGNSLEGFVNRLASQDIDLQVDPSLFGNDLRDFKSLTVEDFRNLSDAIKSLEHAGQATRKVTLAGEKLEKSTVIGDLVAQARSLPGRFVEGRSERMDQLITGWRYHVDAFLTQTKQVFEDLDGGNRDGPFSRIYRTLLEADAQRKDLTAQADKRVAEIKKVEPKNAYEKIQQNLFLDRRFLYRKAELPPLAMTRMDMIGVALNLGNAGNEQRLIHGFWPETKGDIHSYVAKREEVRNEVARQLRPEDWNYVEQVWGFFDWLRPQIDEKMRERTGVGLKVVQANPFDVGGRRVSGGYYPVFYDPLVGDRAPSADTLFSDEFNGVSTYTGYTKERADEPTARQLHITNSGQRLPFRIRQIIADLTMHDAVKDAWSLLNDPRVKTEINTSIGPEYGRHFKSYLQSVANRYVTSEAAFEKVAEMSAGMRGRMAVAVLGLNPSVLFTPAMGDIVRSLKEAGNPYQALRLMFADQKAVEFAENNSAELRHWADGYNRDLNDFMAVPRKGKALVDAAARIGFALPMKIELMFGRLAWNTMYQKARREGRDHADAVFFAERYLKDSFPRQNHLDLAPVMRMNEAVRVLTMFYGFSNFLYNRTRGATQKIKRGDFVDGFTDFLSLTMVPILLGIPFFEFGSAEDDEWPETVAKFVGSNASSMVPLARDLWNLEAKGIKGVQHPGVAAADAVFDATKDVGLMLAGEEPSDKWLRNILFAPGIVFGLPTGGPAKSAQFLYDYQQGEQDAEGWSEFLRGLRTGKSEKE